MVGLQLHLEADGRLRATEFSETQLKGNNYFFLSITSSYFLLDLKQSIERWRKHFWNSFHNSESMTFPNFESELWWPRNIRFLGNPLKLSTKLWEYEKFRNKMAGKRTNHKNVERDALVQVSVFPLKHQKILIHLYREKEQRFGLDILQFRKPKMTHRLLRPNIMS